MGFEHIQSRVSGWWVTGIGEGGWAAMTATREPLSQSHTATSRELPRTVSGTEEVGEMAMTPMCDCWLVADSCVISARNDSRTKRLAVGSTNWHGLKCNDANGCSTERTRDMASSCDEVVRISTAALWEALITLTLHCHYPLINQCA